MRHVELFAVSTDEVQVCWRGASVVADTTLELRSAGDGRVLDAIEVGAGTDSGSHWFSAGRPAPADRRIAVTIDGALVAASELLPAFAPAPRSKVATISDLHVGETGFGRWPRLHSNRDPAQAHPVFCVRAALAEIECWGPDLLVVKGDLAHDNRREEYELVAPLLAAMSCRVIVQPGNHDGGNHRHGGDMAGVLHRHGVEVIDGLAVIDLPGMRVIVADTMGGGFERGVVDDARRRAIGDAVADAPPSGAALVTLHHHLQPRRLPTFVPLGIPHGTAVDLLDTISDLHPLTLITSGHTHRHRARDHGRTTVTEVGSVKDFPGTWAAYETNGIQLTQVVRRIGDPEVLAWTDRCRVMCATVWGRWAPGRLDDRCLSRSI